MVDSIVGHGDRKRDVRSLYVTISDEDLVREIDRMKFDKGQTEIFVEILSFKSERGPLGALEQIH